MGLGPELRQARESRGISLEEVSKRTRIAVKYLEAIEEDRYDVFPSHTYARGFIRAYAKVVGVDPQVLTRQFNNENQPEEVKIESKNIEAELEKTLGWRPMVGRPPVFRRQETENDLNLEMADEQYPEATTQHDPSVIRQRSMVLRKIKWGKWLGQGLAVLALVAIVGAGIFYGVKLLSKIKWGGPRTETTAASQTGEVKVADKYQHLILKGLDKSWVLVTMDDGESSSEVDLDQGEVKTYKAVKNFKLKLGNAGGVDVQFNGKPLGILGTTGQVVEIDLPPGAGSSDTKGDDSSG
jgi:transcriptional regulator with XRE-family HTH domain